LSFPSESNEFQPGLASRLSSLKFDCFGGQKWQVPSGGNVIVHLVSVPGNHNESPMLRDALPQLKAIAKAAGLCLRGTIVSLNGVYDWRRNRKAIFNRGDDSQHQRKHPRKKDTQARTQTTL